MKKQQPTLFMVNIPIFLTRVIVICNYSQEDACEKAFNQYKAKLAVINGLDGWVQESDGDIFMWINNSQKASTVFHELTHIAFSICSITGMNKDEELIAYLIGWLKINVADQIFYQ